MTKLQKKKVKALSERVAFRLTKVDYEEYLRKVSSSGMTSSEFFREAVLKNQTKIVVLAPETKELVLQFNRIGNNLNQMAHRVNADYAAGVIDQSRYDWLHFRLVAIVDYLKGLVPKL